MAHNDAGSAVDSEGCVDIGGVADRQGAADAGGVVRRRVATGKREIEVVVERGEWDDASVRALARFCARMWAETP